MLHTLQQLRDSTVEWLDDPQGDKWKPGGSYTRLDSYINLAYQDVVHEVDGLPVAYNVPRETSAQAKTITTVATQREYEVGAGRRIIEVCPVDSQGYCDVPLEMVNWSQRNSVLGYQRGHVYAFSESGGTGEAKLYVGFVDRAPPYATVRVFYLPQLTRLSAGSDVPSAVPAQYHELIPLRTAVLCKVAENREVGGVGALYAELLGRMRSGMGRMDHHLTTRRY
jgi:hypothetical protein